MSACVVRTAWFPFSSECGKACSPNSQLYIALPAFGYLALEYVETYKFELQQLSLPLYLIYPLLRMPSMSERPFRVIIVGAGPTGLYLACALSKANIDFVVLEQYHTIVNHAGAGIIAWPHTTRLLDQLGLLSAVERHYTDISSKTDLLCGSGYVTRVNNFFATLGNW